MRVKVLSVAVLIASIFALPVPASQLLAGSFSAPSPVAGQSVGDANFVFLLSDPFLLDEMKPLEPVSHVVLDAALKSAAL
jgi:hypothetical protein